MMRRNRFLILLTGTIVFLMLGFMYMWSSFQPYIKNDLGFGSFGAVKWAYTICIVCFSLGIMLDGVLCRFFSARSSAFFGCLSLSAGFLTSSLLTPDSRALIYASYGLCVGLGTGLCYNAWLSNVLPWYGGKSGLASGVLLLGMGMTGLTIMKFIVFPWLMDIDLGWRFAFRVIAVGNLFVGLLGLLFIQKPDTAGTDNKETYLAGINLTTGQMLKTGAFWFFTGWKVIMFAIGLSIAGSVAGIIQASAPEASPGMDNIAIAVAATNVVAVFSFSNGLSRLVSGIVFDRLKAVKTMVLLAALLTATSILLYTVYGNVIFLTEAALALVAFCYGGSTVLGPSYISSVFGQKHYRKNNGLQALSAIPFTILGSQGISAVYDATGSYRLFLIIMIIAGGVAVFMALMCAPGIRRLKENNLKEW